jgi:hypothetical protein
VWHLGVYSSIFFVVSAKCEELHCLDVPEETPKENGRIEVKLLTSKYLGKSF